MYPVCGFVHPTLWRFSVPQKFHGQTLVLRRRKRRNEMASQPQVSLVPPFTRETAAQKVRKAEDGWNSRDPQKVALVYTVDSRWRNRAEFVNGREEIIQFLTRKWNRELEYRLIKELWAFDAAGLMHHRYACINDLPIKASERLFHWPLGPRPADHPGLSELGL